MKSALQKLALYILKKTKYEFDVQLDNLIIEHDKFNIKVQPVGFKEPTAYDFVCHHKDIGFMNSMYLTRYVNNSEIIECPNDKTKGIILDDLHQVKNLEKQYNNLVDSVIKSARVINKTQKIKF